MQNLFLIFFIALFSLTIFFTLTFCPMQSLVFHIYVYCIWFIKFAKNISEYTENIQETEYLKYQQKGYRIYKPKTKRKKM